jgi:predicted  nucleic acid-binding Zn-ribbon protein
MNPEITALYELQKRDRQLTSLERKLALIPKRITELEEDVGKLGEMLEAERRKCDDTRAFQKSQEDHLAEEEEMLRNSRARMSQVKNPRELNAIQREVEQTRRMSSSRSEEIKKIEAAVAEAEQRIASMDDGFQSLKTQADAESERLQKAKVKLEAKLSKLKEGRGDLTGQIETGTLRTYDRIRRRVGGVAFVAVYDRRCTACKMHVPHQAYVSLRKGEEIIACESCGRLLYWQGHFPEEEEAAKKAKEAKPKASPAKAKA